MRVAIIASPYPLEEAPAPPLGISYVAAAFETAGAEVRIFDYIVSRYSPEKLKRHLESFQPDVVGAGSVTLNFSSAAEILQTAKHLNPDIFTVMGGPHVSFDAPDTLKNYDGIDLIVIGEAEKTIAELVASGFSKAAFPGIRGIAYRENGAIRTTESREFIEDISTLPLPARHLLPLSRYQALGFPISMITSRGCPHQCIFCQGRRMVGARIRQRDVDGVVNEIQDILSYGFDRINVADDLFVSDKNKVKAVCDEINRRGLKFVWSAFARVDTVDPETLKLMRETGCDSISFGVESGNQEILDRIKKRITLAQVRKAVDMCKDVGLIVHCTFIVGLPGETQETLNNSRVFAKSLGVSYGYHLLSPFPGTTVRERVADYDLEILTDDWTQYDANRPIVRTSSLAAEDIGRFISEFDAEFELAWNEMKRRYHEGGNSPQDNLSVEGHYRTQLIFKILSGDLIEAEGHFPVVRSSDETLLPLSQRIKEKTGFAIELVEKVIREFAGKGYIKPRQLGDGLEWFWSQNNKESHTAML
jgi:anaerobic magnesium-protoporphyrin IX monomethyl ester cyclase